MHNNEQREEHKARSMESIELEREMSLHTQRQVALAEEQRRMVEAKTGTTAVRGLIAAVLMTIGACWHYNTQPSAPKHAPTPAELCKGACAPMPVKRITPDVCECEPTRP